MVMLELLRLHGSQDQKLSIKGSKKMLAPMDGTLPVLGNPTLVPVARPLLPHDHCAVPDVWYAAKPNFDNDTGHIQ